MTIAALFVDPRGVYANLPDVEVWDKKRDARKYAGPHRVVAHPPCSRWCRLAGLIEARWGHKRGDDGGCFESALESVRKWGGVLEHPAYSDAWAYFGLNRPPISGAWIVADFEGGWTCHVEQGQYGHVAKKATWLYAHGVPLPSLEWGTIPVRDSQAPVSWCGNHTSAFDTRPRVGKKAAAGTPEPFRDVLLGMARDAGDGKWVSPNPTDDPEELARRRKRAGPLSYMTKRAKAATPEEFRDVLLEMVR